MLETCRGSDTPIRLCVEKTKNFVKFNHRGPGGQNFDRPAFPKFEAP